MIETRDNGDGLSDFKYYYYNPSMGAAILFVILFLLTTTLHMYQMFRTRTWFMIAFCIGGAFEVIGYVGRAIGSTETPDWSLGPYIIQSLFLLVAPSLLAASIYMELARIVLMVNGDHALFIRRTWLTKIFVSGDIFSFLMQSTGGGLLATNSAKLGEKIVMAGLGLQILFFFLFIVAAAIFHLRINRHPTAKCARLPWTKHMWSLYIVSMLIFVRCLIRLIEYGQGYSGYILSHEVYLYIFDALFMWLAMFTMNWVHPSEVKALIRGHGKMVYRMLMMREVALEHDMVQRMSPQSQHELRSDTQV